MLNKYRVYGADLDNCRFNIYIDKPSISFYRGYYTRDKDIADYVREGGVNMKPITFLCVVFIMAGMLLPLNTALASNDVPASYRLVAKTDRLELYYNEEQNSIKIKDKINNFIWSSAVDEDEYDKDKIDNFWVQNFNSLFNIGYTDLKEENDQVKVLSSASEESEITTKDIENGISLSYYLKTLDIKLTIEFSLEGDSLNVKIPAKNQIKPE